MTVTPEMPPGDGWEVCPVFGRGAWTCQEHKQHQAQYVVGTAAVIEGAVMADSGPTWWGRNPPPDEIDRIEEARKTYEHGKLP